MILDSLHDYSYKKLGFSLPIRNVNFAITYKCNSRCLSCDIWKRYLKNNSLLKKELLTCDLKKIFSQFDNLRSVGITGGEPFLRNDLVDVVKAIKVHSITISTNGIMSGRILKFVQNMIKIDSIRELGISVSIDAIGELNDKIRGTLNSYEKSLNTIRLLKELQKKNKKLIIGISNTISKMNINDVLKVYKLAKKLNVAFSTRLAQSSSLFYNNVCSKIFIDEKDLHKVREIFQFLLKEQPSNIFYRYYLKKFLKNPNKQATQCFSGFNSFFLDPYGNIYPCIMLNKGIGNLKKKSLKELLNSNDAIKIKEYVKQGKCSCWTDCEAINSIYSNPIALIKASLCIFGI